jgi:hypothetical protein
MLKLTISTAIVFSYMLNLTISYRTTEKQKGKCKKEMLINAKLQIGKRSQQIELTGRKRGEGRHWTAAPSQKKKKEGT